MIPQKSVSLLMVALLIGAITSCHKEKPPPVFKPRKVVYLVAATNMRLNFIDSNVAFQKDKIYSGLFRYEFKRGPGMYMGLSIHKLSPADTIYSWRLEIDDKLYANGFSEGGVYMTIPSPPY